MNDGVTAARRALDRVRREHDESIRRQQTVSKDLSAVGVGLVDVAARADLRAPAIDDDDPTSLEAAIGALTMALDDADKTDAAEREMTQSDLGAARQALGALLEDLGIESEFAAELTRAEARHEWLGTEIARDQAEVDAASGTIAQRDETEARRSLFARLASDLTDAKFVRYLLDDERARLADLGSDHFQRLSSGRYRFTDDGKFGVVDLTAAEAVRKAESLSGGETFLASLGLALALAEMVSRSGGRLDSFFLDEGFGTLDPEHLDLAMEGIEHLAAGSASRLVVLVSHVPELRHRLEDLIELDKSPVTGDTRVVRA